MKNLNRDEMAIIGAEILEKRRSGNEIMGYWHRAKCCAEDNPQLISVRWRPKGIQVCLQKPRKNGCFQVVYRWLKSVHMGLTAYVTTPTQ